MTLRIYKTALVATLLSSLAALGSIGGCSDSTSTQNGSCSGDLASIRQDIFLKSCTQAGCHSATQPAASLDLSRTDVEAALVNQPAALCSGTLVVPGDPANSVLFQKLNNPSCGARMPMTGVLSNEQIVCVYQWISEMPGGAGGSGGAGGNGSGGNGAGGGSSCEMCGGTTCVDLQSDAQHCGSCMNACGANMVCNMGMCAGGCGQLMQCGSSCTDTQTDAKNCGSCGNACTGTPCTAGKCECPAGQTICSGKCVDTTSDPNNCGACGQQCAVGQSCTDGKCACGTSSVSFSGAVQPILTTSCATAGCHAGVMPQEGLNLTAAKSYASMVNVAAKQCTDGRMRIKPGDPGASYVIDKMTGVDMCFGTKMPKLGGVQTAQIQTLIDWVCQGAQNN